MSKPLKSLLRSTTVSGKLKANYSNQQVDEKGNPLQEAKVGRIKITVKIIDDQPKYRTTYGVLGDRLIVECHILKSWYEIGDNLISIKLKPSDFVGTVNNDQISLTIISNAQYNLKPITKVMGIKFLAIQEGNLY